MEVLGHDPVPTPEQLVLQRRVDEMIRQSDLEVMRILGDKLKEVRRQACQDEQ